MQLSRPENYLSIYQSGCNFSCRKCHSANFSQRAAGQWHIVEELVEMCREYERRVTVVEPRSKVTAWRAGETCRWTVVTAIFKGRTHTPNERYAALASHYAFELLFCMPARGNEKAHAENRVYDLQRRWATPVPRVQDLAKLNAYLRACCV